MNQLILFGIFAAILIVIIFIMINKKPKHDESTECLSVVSEQPNEQNNNLSSTKADPELQDQINQVLDIQDQVLQKMAKGQQKL